MSTDTDTKQVTSTKDDHDTDNGDNADNGDTDNGDNGDNGDIQNGNRGSPRGSITDSFNSDQIDEVIGQLNLTQIDQADDLTDTSSVSGRSSSSSKESFDDKKDQQSKGKESGVPDSKTDADKIQRQTSTESKKEKKKGPLAFLRRLSSKDMSKEAKQPSKTPTILKIRVESLPQYFVTKYLGCRECTGIWGAQHTVKPVQEMIEAAKTLGEGQDLSLVKVKVTGQGLEVSSHKQNKGPDIESGLIPVQYISYGVQDFKFTRVFSFIMVREMSYKAKKMECHAYVCPSTLNARKMSLSVALAFKEYAKSLNGKQFRFQVELCEQPAIDESLPSQDEEQEEEC